LNDAIKEVMQVANARGVNLDQISLKKTWDFFDNLPPQGTASMQRDIMDGKPSELESQTGTIVRYGKESNVPTPINTFIYNSLLPAEKIARGSLNIAG
jgi:2-dehydropantoate 2-reductase